MGLFNNERIDSLEQSVTALTEDLQKKDNQIESLFINLQELADELSKTKSENKQLEEKYNTFTTSITNTMTSLLQDLTQDIENIRNTETEDVVHINDSISRLRDWFNDYKIECSEHIVNIQGEINTEKEAKDLLLEDVKNLSDNLESSILQHKNTISKVSNDFMEEINLAKNQYEYAIKDIANTVNEINKRSNDADEEHNKQLELLRKSTDSLVAKCNELQKENARIIEEHKDMIARYEESIKKYKEHAEKMKNNVLKKMNMSNVFEVKEG